MADSGPQNPLLSGVVQNEVREAAKQAYKDTLRLLFKNFWQAGHLGGELPPANKEQEWFTLVMNEPRNMQVALDETALAGDRQRAQAELIRRVRLESEIFDD